MKSPIAEPSRRNSGVRGDGDVGARIDPAQDSLDFVARAHRHRRLGHHHGESLHLAGDLLGGGVYIGEIGVAVAAPRGRPHGDEHRVGLRHRLSAVDREEQAALAHIALYQRGQPGLVDRHDPVFETGDLAGVPVYAGHRVAKVGEARPRHQADVTGSDHRYMHDLPMPSRRRPRQPRPRVCGCEPRHLDSDRAHTGVQTKDHLRPVDRRNQMQQYQHVCGE